MTKKEKLLDKLLKLPSDYTWQELCSLLDSLGFEEVQGNGSRVKFVHIESRRKINIHKPHPKSILKKYQLKEIISILKEIGRVK